MTSNVDNEHPSDHYLTEITRFENVFGSPLTYESRECFVHPGNREPFIQMFSFEHICAYSWSWLFPCVLSASYCFLFSDMTINIYSKSLYFYIIFGSITGLLFYKFKIQKGIVPYN